MKITLRTQYYSDDDRRALWWNMHGNGYTKNPATCPMASREECRNHLENVGHSDDMDMNDEWMRDIERWDEANKHP